jgi:serine beta-lactamase-like protein LACTB
MTALALGLALVVASSEAPPSPLPAAQVRTLEAAAEAFRAERKIPGLTVAVVLERQLRWTGGFGQADVENGVPADADTMYRLASLSKPMTATAVMQLVEKGKIDLDAPVQRYVPSFPEKPWPITTRQLLVHLGGIRHYRPDERFDATRRFVSVLEGLDMFKEDPLVHEPGTAYLYSTYGYTLLGAIVESAAGVPYLEYMRERVWRPARMESIRDDDARALIPHRAQGYARIADGELRNSHPADTSYKIPGGGLTATASDVARFAAALQQGVLVRPDTTAAMFARQRTRSGRYVGYGLGWGVQRWKGRSEILHSGSQERVNNVVYMLPDRGLVVVVLTNLEGCRPTDLARRLAEILAP